MTNRADDAAQAAEKFLPRLPASVELDPEVKKRVIGGVKAMLLRLQQAGFVRPAEYGAVIGNASTLLEFVNAYRAHRDQGAEIALDAQGAPVRDDWTPLACGVNLAQVEQMLVFTCAKRMFAEAEGKPKAAAPVAEKGGLFRKKPDAVAAPQKTDGDRKLDELKHWIAFAWQLPLIKYYFFLFERGQLAELGRDITLFRTQDELQMIASFDVVKLRKARKVAGSDLTRALAANPRCVYGLNWWGERRYPLFLEAMRDRVWHFYARDEDYFELVEEVDRERVMLYGPLLADLAPEALTALNRLAIDRLPLFLSTFLAELGKGSERLLADSGFARNHLDPICRTFADHELEKDKFVEVVALKCKALELTLAGPARALHKG
ncbi:MAG: hypothetical protein HQL41_04760 [Alphaproteobacteria bacterium]|nr:hypothetical protein [Alphaproteobacteria bacterium]